ncbi:MAG TPA: hypothetical protein VFF26_11645 [Gallionella sp.]|nr:hypothetical protein [Gallionella sp.]
MSSTTSISTNVKPRWQMAEAVKDERQKFMDGKACGEVPILINF